MTPTATFSIPRRMLYMILFAALLLAVAFGLFLAERTGAPTPVSRIAAVAVSTKKAPPAAKPSSGDPCETHRARGDSCKKHCDDTRKHNRDDDCRPPSGKTK